MHLRYEYDTDAFYEWAHAHFIPMPDRPRRWVMALQVLDAEEAHEGYVWYWWADTTTMQFHIHLHDGSTRKWTRRLVKDIHDFPRLIGAKRLIATDLTAEAEVLALKGGWLRRSWGAETVLPNPTHGV